MLPTCSNVCEAADWKAWGASWYSPERSSSTTAGNYADNRTMNRKVIMSCNLTTSKLV